MEGLVLIAFTTPNGPILLICISFAYRLHMSTWHFNTSHATQMRTTNIPELTQTKQKWQTATTNPIWPANFEMVENDQNLDTFPIDQDVDNYPNWPENWKWFQFCDGTGNGKSHENDQNIGDGPNWPNCSNTELLAMIQNWPFLWWLFQLIGHLDIVQSTKCWTKRTNW